MQGAWVQSLVREIDPLEEGRAPLEEGRATLSSILAWRIPMLRGAWWAIGSQRVRLG